MLLLASLRSYRSEAFADAAARLGIELVSAADLPLLLTERSGLPLGVDFAHPDAAAQLIVDYAASHPVTAILPVDDSGVITAAKAARLLGLPHNAPTAAEAVRDKHRMRSLMAAAGVPCPFFARFTTAQEPAAVAESVPYPCVVKPLHLNGSRGVMRADTPADLAIAIRRLARLLDRLEPDGRPKPYLVESFIPGFEVALEGLLDAGELHVLALFDKPDPLDGPFFEETIYVTPSRLPATVQSAVVECAGRAARSIGLEMGPVHAELRVNADGPWMLEIAGRSIGGLCSRTLRFDAGATLEELILRQACGLPLPIDERTGRASGVMMIPIPVGGILRRVEGVDEARAVPAVEEVEITAPLHYTLTPLPEGDSYLGFIFARAETPAQVEVALRTAHTRLRFEIAPEFALESALPQRLKEDTEGS